MWFLVIRGRRKDCDELALTNKLLNAVLAEAQVVCVGVSLSLMLEILTLILRLSPVLPRGLPLVSSLTWRLLSLLGLVVLLRSLAESSWRKVLVLGVTLWWLALMPWLLLLPVGSRIDGSLPTFPSWQGLFRAYCCAGGPVAGGAQRYLGRGRLRVRRRRLGGCSVGGVGSSRLYRVSQGDDVDVSSAQYFVNSSLAPVILFRRRLKSVADVLKGIRHHGFSQDRLDALHRYWAAVCRQGPCGPVFSLEPWAGWIPPDLHGFSIGLWILWMILFGLLSKWS